MRALTQWHNSCATCSGFRSRRASALYLKTKGLRGMLFHVVTHCKEGEESGWRCVRVWGGVTHIPLAFVDLQLPKVEWSSQCFCPRSLMLIICLTGGCLKNCLLLGFPVALMFQQSAEELGPIPIHPLAPSSEPFPCILHVHVRG